jgi:hypothetical protein
VHTLLSHQRLVPSTATVSVLKYTDNIFGEANEVDRKK